MTVTTLTSVGNGLIRSTSSVYSTSRAGGTLDVQNNTDNFEVGQKHSNLPSIFSCRESFLKFDTSAIPDTDEILSVELQLYQLADLSTAADFIIEARTLDWGASSDTGDWVAGASLGTPPLLASLSTNGIGASNAYKSLISEVAFLTATGMKTGTVYILLNSSRHRVGNQPGTATNEEVIFAGFGDANPPKLVVTHQAAVVPIEEIQSDLSMTVGLAGALTVPPLIVPSLTGGLPVAIGMSGVLEEVILPTPFEHPSAMRSSSGSRYPKAQTKTQTYRRASVSRQMKNRSKS